MSIFLLSLTATAAMWVPNPPLAFDADGGATLQVGQAKVTYANLTLDGCTAGSANTMGPADMNLASSPTVYGPDDTCSVTLTHNGTLKIIGDDFGDAGFTLDLSMPTLEYTCAGGIDAGTDATDPIHYAVDLLPPGWTTVSELGLVAGEHITLDSNWASHDTVRDRILDGAAIYVDSDDDGRIDAVERSAGPVCTPI